MYDEKQKEYDERLQEVTQSINASEQVDNSFYITAKYILELAKHSGELFEQANMLERKTLINTVLTNIKWNGEKLVYDYIKPFNLLVNFQNNLNGVKDRAYSEHQFIELLKSIDTKVLLNNLRVLFQQFNIQVAI